MFFFKKIICQNRYVELETPPPFMAKTILNFHFDYWNPSLTYSSSVHIESEQLQGPGSQLAAQRARPKSRLSRSLCWFKSNLFSAAQVPAHRLNQKPSSAIFFLSDQVSSGISYHQRTYSKTFYY